MTILVVLSCIVVWLACVMANVYMVGRMGFGHGWSEENDEAGAITGAIMAAPIFLVVVLLLGLGRKFYAWGRKNAS